MGVKFHQLNCQKLELLVKHNRTEKYNIKNI